MAANLAELYSVGYRASYVIIGRRNDADQCAREALARTLSRWNSVRDSAAGRVVLIATELALERARQISATALPVSGSSYDPSSARRSELVRGLRTLPKRQRDAVVLRHIAGQADVQVAAALGCRVEVAAADATAGFDRLRQLIGPQRVWEG